MGKDIITKSIEDEEIKQFATYYEGRMLFVDNLQKLDPRTSIKVEAFVAVL